MESNEAKGAEVISNKWGEFLKYKITKQVGLGIVWLALGLMLEVIGPTLQDLMDLLDANYEQIGRALLGKSAGFFLGALIGGFLHEIFHSKSDLIMAIGISIGAVGIGLVPWSPNVAVCGFLLSLTGVSEGIINTGGNTMTMELWQDKATGPMHSLHFGFGVGAILIPQISRPFLSKGEPPCDNSTGQCVVNGTISTEEYRPSRMDILYPIVGVFVLLVALMMFIFFVVGAPKGFPRREGKTNLKPLLSPATCAAGNAWYGTTLIAILFCYFIQATGSERACGKYLASFAVDSQVGFTKDQAATLLSTFWFCHMAGRFSGIFIGQFVSVQNMILGDIIASVPVTIVLAIWGYNSPVVLWIFTGFIGYLISLLFPSGMSWANVYMDVNSMAVMVFLMGASCGGFLYQYVPGYLFEYYGTRSLMYILLFGVVVLGIIFSIMSFIVYKHGGKKALHPLDLADKSEIIEADNENNLEVINLRIISVDNKF